MDRVEELVWGLVSGLEVALDIWIFLFLSYAVVTSVYGGVIEDSFALMLETRQEGSPQERD